IPPAVAPGARSSPRRRRPPRSSCSRVTGRGSPGSAAPGPIRCGAPSPRRSDPPAGAEDIPQESPWSNVRMNETRWLNEDEQRMWRRYRDVNQLLELAIERQLQRDAGMSQSDYAVLVSLSEAEGMGLRARQLGAELGWDR